MVVGRSFDDGESTATKCSSSHLMSSRAVAAASIRRIRAHLRRHDPGHPVTTRVQSTRTDPDAVRFPERKNRRSPKRTPITLSQPTTAGVSKDPEWS